MRPYTFLQPFGDRIWIVDGPRVHMMTIPFDTRMTIVEIAPRELWLHSPVQPADELVTEVRSLGEVKHIVAPNKIHSLGIEPWGKLYPDAEIHVSPCFTQRHPSMEIDSVLATGVPFAWYGEIETLSFEGSSYLDEIVFFHEASGTLILTDLIQRHVAEHENWFWRFVKKSAGILGTRGGTPRDLQATMKNRAAAKKSVQAMLEWRFDRVIIAHGHCITRDARSTVKKAFTWALS